MDYDNRVSLSDIRQIVRETDPNKAVGKVIEQLHKDLAEIDKQMDKARGEDRVKLGRIKEKLQEALLALKGVKSGGKIDDITMGLRIELNKGLDPVLHSMVKDHVNNLEKMSDHIRKLKAKESAVIPMTDGVII